MGKLTSTGFAVLTAMVEEHGEANILEEVAGRIAEGETLRDVTQTYGIPYSTLWRWLKDKPERMAAYRQGLEARAEAEAHRMMDIADNASPEDVAVARLRTDVRKYLVSKWGKETYGDGNGGGGVTGGITIVIGRVNNPRESQGITVEGETV